MAVGASIGARLEHLRARKGVSDAELAKAFGINRSTMGRILKGETEKVSSQMIIDAAKYFGVSRLSSGSNGHAGSHESSGGEFRADRRCGHSNSF